MGTGSLGRLHVCAHVHDDAPHSDMRLCRRGVDVNCDPDPAAGDFFQYPMSNPKSDMYPALGDDVTCPMAEPDVR